MLVDFPRLDYFSLILGFLVTIFLVWIVNFLYQEIKKWKVSKSGEQKIANKNRNSLASWEKRYRGEIYLKAQSNHLSSPLFSLEEIIVPPRFLVPPQKSKESGEISRDDVFSSLPYIPGWPELASKYKTPTVDINDLLNSEADFIILGFPGMGKSVALAYITSQVAKMDVGNITTGELIPFYFHISEIVKRYSPSEILELITDLVTVEKSGQSRTLDFVKEIFDEGRAIVLIDGMDELSPNAFEETSSIIINLKTSYPKVKIIATGSPYYFGKLVSLNFIPITLAGWTDLEKEILSTSWGKFWNEKINNLANSIAGDLIDPVVINAWLKRSNCRNPFALTLALWSTYLGDACNQSYLDTLQAYISRSTPINYRGAPLDNLARQLIFSNTLDINKENYNGLRNTPTASGNKPDGISEKTIEIDTAGIPLISSSEKSPEEAQEDSHQASWIIKNIRAHKYQFSHPIIPAFLAGKSFTEAEIDKVLAQPRWLGRDISLQIFTLVNKTSYVFNKLKISEPPLHDDLFMIGRWLHDAFPGQQCTEQVISRLFNLIDDDKQTLIIRCKAVISLVDLINSTGIIEKFRDLQFSASANHQFLGSIGSGALKDLNSINTLSRLALAPSTHVRNSACLALAFLGSRESIDALGQILDKGNDFQKKSAAEALSLHKELGHAILRDGISIKGDLMVRRASVFGIAMIREKWASDLLSRLQFEEAEWIVKTAANEVLESQKVFPALRTNKVTPASETPWIIAYASKLGMGLIPTKSPVDILLTALKSGSLEEKIESLQYLKTMPGSRVFEALYISLNNGEPELRESTFSALNEMAMSGIELPSPYLFS